jgi:hypothetical protein
MTRTRRALVATSFVLVAALAIAYAGWWWGARRVNVLVVNASSHPVEYLWQPAPFAEMTGVTKGGCEAMSNVVAAGAKWLVRRDDDAAPILESSQVSVPPLARLVAVEVYLAADGSTRVVPAHEVAAPLDAPYPECESPA